MILAKLHNKVQLFKNVVEIQALVKHINSIQNIECVQTLERTILPTQFDSLTNLESRLNRRLFPARKLINL